MDEISKGAWDVDDDRLDEFLRDVKSTRFSSLTEFGRAVHAEMDAITTAARKGIPLAGAQLVCTTYPCHNCTRHIVACGISRVVYVYPYSKSLATELHSDALVVEPAKRGLVKDRVVFEQYIGVAPRLYPQAFHFDPDDRKDLRGAGMRIVDPNHAIPRMLHPHSTFTFGGPAFPNERTVSLEAEAVAAFTGAVRTKKLQLPAPMSKEITS
ncbi:MAG: deaminase [Solirubrobacteraceae bacterium]